MRHQSEASVEEILDSIKKVIARDNREGAIEERRRKSQLGIAEADAGEEPLVESTPEPATADEAEEILDLSEADFAEDGQETQEGAPETPLTRDAMSDSIRDNFAALSMLAQPGAQPQIVRSGETSLEGLTRELLRPMLAEWLDANLPTMVERMVQAEIARIAGKRS